MLVYLDLVVFLNFLVDWLLLLAVNRLVGYPPSVGRTALGAGFGAVYAGVCMIPGLRFLGNWLWRIVSLVGVVGIAFGLHRSSIRRGVLFFLLSMALGGLASGLTSRSFFALICAAVGVLLLCMIGFRGNAAAQDLIHAELSFQGKRVQLTALRDTGNTLRDPVTGQQVMIAGADVAQMLVGLTQKELNDPIGTLAQRKIPGLRLIPYQAVGKPAGMLLAMRISDVKVGSWKGSGVVAFAPEPFGKEKGYQMLAGGML